MTVTHDTTSWRLSLGLKIWIGFTLVAMITLIVGLAGLLGVGRMASTVEKTSVATEAFVAMNEANRSFSHFLLSVTEAEGATTSSRIDDVGRIVGHMDNGTESFAKARSSLSDLKSQIVTVLRSQESMNTALAAVDASTAALTSTAANIVKTANQTAADAFVKETTAIEQIDAIDKVVRPIDRIYADVFKISSMMSEYALTRDENLQTQIALMLGGFEFPLQEISSSTVDAPTAKSAGQLAKSLTQATQEVDSLLKLAEAASAPDSPEEARTAFADAVAALRSRFDSASMRVDSMRAAIATARRFAMGDLVTASKDRNVAKEAAAAGQAFGDRVARLVTVTKDYMARAGLVEAKPVLDEITAMQTFAKASDEAGSTKDVAGLVADYRKAFETIAAAMDVRRQVTGEAEKAVTVAISGIAAIAAQILDDANASSIQMRLIATIAMLAGGVITAAIALITVRSLRNPITALTETMRRLADGDTSIEPQGLGRSDEIGEMSRAVNVFRDAALAKAELEGQSRLEAAERAERQARIEAMIGQFRSDVEAMLAEVTSQTVRMQSTADRLTRTADVSQQQATAATGASSDASANVATVAASAEELASSVQEITDRVSRTVEVVGHVSGRATDSNVQISGLAGSASRIGDVVKLIRSIADQTNLLALNATIEAARAGEAGRGFSVVASEVKQLADQTARATHEIASQVEGIQTAAQTAVDSIGQIARSMQDVNDYTASIAAAMSQQGGATSEISRNAHAASERTEITSRSMVELVRSAAETADAAGDVNRVAHDVSATNRSLTETIDRFLKSVAAA